MRVPLMQGLPKQTLGLILMRCKRFAMMYIYLLKTLDVYFHLNRHPHDGR